MAGNEVITDYYTLGKTLGQGAYGLVKKAILIETGEEFAVKIINKTKLEDNELNALQNEVELLSAIDHPNIVKLYEVFEDENEFYMIMELMQGGELFERIVEMDNFSEKLAAETIKPIIDALHYMHQNDMCHRDLKPQNLLFATKDTGSVIKITDFGLAKLIENQQLMKTQCGTPAFVAPEILAEKGYTVAVDFWSLGVITYVMLSGSPPFYHDNENELFEVIQKGEVSFAGKEWEIISNNAKDFIYGLLQVDPQKRYGYQQCMDHPWMKESSNSNIPNIQTNIKSYNIKFKVMGHALLAISAMLKPGKKPN